MKLYYNIIEDYGKVSDLLDQAIKTGVTDQWLQEELYNDFEETQSGMLDKYLRWRSNEETTRHYDINIVAFTIQETTDEFIVSVVDYEIGEIKPNKDYYGVWLANLFTRRK